MIKTSYNEQEIVIGQYMLGLLDRKDNEDTQQLLGSDPAAAQCALAWESNFLELVDALPPVSPPHTVLEQILSALDLPLEPDEPEVPEVTAVRPVEQQLHSPQPDTSPEVQNRLTDEPPINQSLTADTPRIDKAPGDSSPVRRPVSNAVWLGGGATGLIFVAVLALAFLPMRPPEPPITIVELAPTQGAILQAPGQSSTPGWVVTIDIDGNVLLTPKVHTDTPSDASVQLWTYSKTLSQPRSLGLIDPNQPVAVPSALIGKIGEDQYFEMTLEPEGGAPASEPSGPILFIGRVVTFGKQ